mmetsp:Transcript_62803/g.182165  ORF Transcript_62803/g.182165 Transcript_62803/m.182165 type:complete len:389 (-) Transcript_62803:50-1216(-)
MNSWRVRSPRPPCDKQVGSPPTAANRRRPPGGRAAHSHDHRAHVRHVLEEHPDALAEHDAHEDDGGDGLGLPRPLRLDARGDAEDEEEDQRGRGDGEAVPCGLQAQAPGGGTAEQRLQQIGAEAPPSHAVGEGAHHAVVRLVVHVPPLPMLHLLERDEQEAAATDQHREAHGHPQRLLPVLASAAVLLEQMAAVRHRVGFLAVGQLRANLFAQNARSQGDGGEQVRHGLDAQATERGRAVPQGVGEGEARQTAARDDVEAGAGGQRECPTPLRRAPGALGARRRCSLQLGLAIEAARRARQRQHVAVNRRRRGGRERREASLVAGAAEESSRAACAGCRAADDLRLVLARLLLRIVVQGEGDHRGRGRGRGRRGHGGRVEQTAAGRMD